MHLGGGGGGAIQVPSCSNAWGLLGQPKQVRVQKVTRKNVFAGGQDHFQRVWVQRSVLHCAHV